METELSWAHDPDQDQSDRSCWQIRMAQICAAAHAYHQMLAASIRFVPSIQYIEPLAPGSAVAGNKWVAF